MKTEEPQTSSHPNKSNFQAVGGKSEDPTKANVLYALDSVINPRLK